VSVATRWHRGRGTYRFCEIKQDVAFVEDVQRGDVSILQHCQVPSQFEACFGTPYNDEQREPYRATT